MLKKLKWPVAKVREDGTPAIWLDYTNWSIIRDGIVRKYLECRQDEGRMRARREARTDCPLSWKHNARLQTWAFLDRTDPLYGLRRQDVLELYRVGLSAHGHSSEPITVEKLVAIGDQQDANGYKDEQRLIAQAAPNCDAVENKEVA